MNKKLILCLIIILLIILGFSGCFEDNNDDNKNNDVNLFIGKWKSTIYYFDENGIRHEEKSSNTTFFNNNTMGSESVEDNTIIWTPFFIENNQICFGEFNDPEYLCYYYEFSENGSKVTLITSVTNPYSEYGETYELVIKLKKI